jgi:hypothetical protein
VDQGSFKGVIQMENVKSILTLLDEKDKKYIINDTSISFTIEEAPEGRKVVMFRDDSGAKMTAMLFI